MVVVRISCLSRRSRIPGTVLSVIAIALPVFAAPPAHSASYRAADSQLCVTMVSIDGQPDDTTHLGPSIRVCVPDDLVPSSAAAAAWTVRPGSAGLRTTGSETGYPTVGKFFFKVAHLVNFNCTGTVISALSGQAGLVLVAAHCLYGNYDDITYGTDDWKFVPEWHDNKAPLGTWQIKQGYYPNLWPYNCHLGHCDFNPRYDFGLLIMKKLNNQFIGTDTGSDGWAVNEPQTVGVTVAGIPGNSKETLISHSESHTVEPTGVESRQASTPGFGAGASGGPWFYKYSTSHRLRYLLA